MVASRERRQVGEALGRIAGALESLELGPGAGLLRPERDRLARVVRTYLIPRAEDPTVPTTVVVAGPTGSGKSTLVNSLIGKEVSRTGALRPTTRVPVVVTPAEQAHRYESIGGVPCEVVAEETALEGMALVDTPDIDSTATSHRATAEKLIDTADIVVFVTSALRYADEVPWQVLRRAVARGTPVIQVLNRVGSASSGAIVDFRSRLAAADLDDELTIVSEHHLGGSARVPPPAVRSLRRRLEEVVAERDVFAGEVFSRVLRSTLAQIDDLLAAISRTHHEIERLEDEISLDLVGRVVGLDLSGVTGVLYPDPPTGRGTRSVRRWKRKSRLDDAAASEAEDSVVRRLVAVIEADLRDWLVGEPESLRRRGVDHPSLLDGARTLAASAARDWIDFVARISADHDERHLRLGEMVLLDAAVSEILPDAAVLLCGEQSASLAGRARLALEGRLEVVYERIAALIAEQLGMMHGAVDSSELEDALGAATITLAPIYA